MRTRCTDANRISTFCVLVTDMRSNRLAHVPQMPKRARANQSSSELIKLLSCPITQELFIDPVTARDGKVYERSAIVEAFKRNKRSPITNVEIEPTLLDARHVIDIIENAIKTGDINGDAAEEWQHKTAVQEQERQQLRDKRKSLQDAAASGNDEKAIIKLAVAYESGQFGFPKSLTASIDLLEQGSKKNMTNCMIFLSLYLLRSTAHASIASGMSWMATSAAAGNRVACMILGIAFAPRSSLPECFINCQFVPRLMQSSHHKSTEVAASWFRKALDGYTNNQCDNLIQQNHLDAIRQWLSTNEPTETAASTK